MYSRVVTNPKIISSQEQNSQPQKIIEKISPAKNLQSEITVSSLSPSTSSSVSFCGGLDEHLRGLLNLDRITSENTKQLLEAIFKKHVNNNNQAVAESNSFELQKYPFRNYVCNESFYIKSEKYHFFDCNEIASELLTIFLIYNIDNFKSWESTIQSVINGIKKAHKNEIKINLLVNVEQKLNVDTEHFTNHNSKDLSSIKFIFESDFSVQSYDDVGRDYFRAEIADYVGKFIENLNTKFLFMGENLSDYDLEDHSLSRLVREIDLQGLDFIKIFKK